MRRATTRLVLAALGLVLAVVPGPRASAGVIYDAAADFSLASNPNGVWSYGTTGTTPTGPLTLFSTVQTNIGGTPQLNGWVGTELGFGNNFPQVVENQSGSTQAAFDVVLLPGQLTLHPAPEPSGSYAVTRFTAPMSGVYQLSTAFEGREFQGTGPATYTDVHVLLNGVSLFDGVVHGFDSPSDQAFATALNLSAGDRVDFSVGIGPDRTFEGDTTALSATLDLVGVPEPSTLAGAATGIVLAVGCAWRRRRIRAAS
jgi:hypothetical protein